MKSIALIFLALLVAISSTGLAVFKHICSEDGVEISYFLQGEDPCHIEEEEVASCCKAALPESTSLSFTDDCCDTEFNWIQLGIDLDLTSLWPSVVNYFWSETPNFYVEFIQPESVGLGNHFFTRPPPKWKNYLAFIQVLRI